VTDTIATQYIDLSSWIDFIRLVSACDRKVIVAVFTTFGDCKYGLHRP